jgi:hypothetical protein
LGGEVVELLCCTAAAAALRQDAPFKHALPSGATNICAAVSGFSRPFSAGRKLVAEGAALANNSAENEQRVGALERQVQHIQQQHAEKELERELERERLKQQVSELAALTEVWAALATDRRMAAGPHGNQTQPRKKPFLIPSSRGPMSFS